MKINKKIIITVLLVLIMLCIISTASATESLNENLTISDTEGVIDEYINEPLTTSDSEDILSEGNTITVEGGGEGKIAAAVNEASSGDTIYIKNGEYLESKIQSVSKQLTFVGESQEGVLIKSSSTSGFFQTSESYISLTFSKLTFKDINGGNLGVINIGADGIVNINNCTFDNCKSKYGAMRLFTTGIVNLENINIINCNSTSTTGASGIELAGAGSQTWNIKNLYIENSKAGNNNFGVVYLNSNSHDYNIENLTIKNSSGLVFAAIYTKGTVNINGSRIINNNLTREGSGIIYLGGKDKTVKIESSEISSNIANYFLTSNTNGNINLNYNNIQDNKPYTVNDASLKINLDANYWGSNSLPEGITASSWIVENNGDYELNTGESVDVIIPGLNDQTAENEVEYNIYVDCYAADGGDGSKTNPFNTISAAVSSANSGDTIYIKNGEYVESSLSFTKTLNLIGESKNGVNVKSNGNIALLTTAYDVSGIVLSFENITFKDSARTGGNGLMFFSGNVDLNFDNCNFIDLSSKYGAIQTNTAGTITISNCLFDNVKEKTTGGTGLMYLNGGGLVNIYDTVISNCGYEATSGQMNALIYVYGSSNVLNIERTTIKNTKGAAGSLIRTAGEVNIKNSNIINNTIELSSTGASGDSLFYVTKTLNIEQSVISDNNGPKNLIYSGSSANIVMNYNNIQNNTFESGFKTVTGSLDAEYNYWGSNSLPDGITATHYVIMDSEGHFTDDQGNALAKEIPQLNEEDESQHTVIDSIYVSESGSDDNDGSSTALAVKTIAHAISIAENGKIIILPGEYTLTETLSIDKDLNIEGRGNVIIKSSSQIISTIKSLNLTNIKFDSTADVDGTIVSSNNDLNIDSCVFISNTESGSAIYVDGGNVNIRNSVLLNPSGYSLKVLSSTVVANDNWWGKNDGANTQASVSSWIVMNADVDLKRINTGDEVIITVKFINNDGSEYDGDLPEFNVTFTALNLDEIAVVKNNQASVKYTVNTDDEATITSGLSIKVPLKLYDPPEIIYVNATGGLDTNDGDEAHPVQSISKAIELAKKGKIVILDGTYIIDDTLTINNDLDITGEGTVIIDGNNKRILNNNANLNITNIQFTNALDSSAVIVNNANLTLNKTLFYSNVNLNGFSSSVIRNNKKLVIMDSKFYENKERYGNIYNNGGELLINTSEFYNNDLSGVTTTPTGLAVYSDAGNVLIENSRFHDNKGNFSVIYFLSKDSLGSSVINNLTINNCTFENNQLVRYGVIYAQKSNTKIKDSSFINNTVKKSSIANGEGSAIYVNGEKVSVETSIFINNNADDLGKDIYIYSGELTISDSVLINNNGYSIEKSDSAVVDANNNWWGANTPNTPISIDKWMVMTVTSNDSDIQTGDEITITASFTKNNIGEDYTGNLPEVFNVTFTATNLNEVKTVQDKKAEVTYIVDNADKVITITSNNAEDSLKINRILDIIYVSNEGNDNNDGDRESPVASLQKAIELAVKGQIIILEGNYQTNDLGIISDDLTITGEGKVIIDANNNNRILYVGQDAKIVLKNLIMINGYTTEEESGALLGNNGDLTLINCTLSDSTSSKNGGAIFNANSLTVINSTFKNNKANENGGAIFTQQSGVGVPTITVSNSIFKSNSAKGKSNYGGGAIYIQQAADGVLIENSQFEENTCTEYGGGAIEIAQVNIATIDNCTFIKNSANSQDDKTRSNYGGGAVSFKGIYSDTKETLTINNSLFLDNNVNECGGGAVFVMYATVDIHNSVLINNGDKNGVSVYGRDADVAPAKITANDNWWGSNDNPKSSINRGTLNRWAILTINNASEIKEGETVKLTVSINKYTTGSENATLTNPIKVERPVTIHTNNEDITGVLVNGEFTTDYTVPNGLKIISTIVDSETQILTVITTQTTLELENITGLMGDRLTYNIKVNSNDGSVVKTGNVELYFEDDLIAIISVEDGIATGNIIINKETGLYTVTAKYIDTTKEFADNEKTASLNVTGIDNIVTSETFSKFFEGNVLKSDLPFKELFFEGTFENLGILNIDKTIKLTGRNTIFKQTVFQLNADNIELNNINIELTDAFEDNDGAAVYIGGNNIIVSNNNITYNASDDTQSYAIELDSANDVKIINNNIKYTANSIGGVKTIGVNVYSSNNLVFDNNTLDLTIPSVAIRYNADYSSNIFSEGIYVENSKNTSITKNNISIKYNSIGAGGYDTIYGVHLTGCDDAKITQNNIELNGHSYAYGFVIDGKNFEISKNTIKSESDSNYAAGLNINEDSTGIIESNNIIATSPNIAYALYADDWGYGSELIAKNNNITATSNTAYGATFTAKTADISGNNIVANGNYTIALGVKNADSNITNNKIHSNGNNIGESVDDYPIINPIETLGIYSEKANVNIEGNDISSTGAKSILLKNSTGDIKNNELVANGVKGDSTISTIDSNVTITNTNKPVVNPVIKITGKNNVKIDYGTGFKVRVTIDGKSVGAGKQVTLKIAGKTLKAKTDKNGYVTFNLAVKPKAYTVTVTYNKVSQKYKLTVKNIIKAKNIKVKKSAKKLKIKVTLKAAKKPIKSKKVILKIKGKKITAKTNKKGVATFKVKKNILKKLKAGKKYKFTVTYGKDTVKKTLKVKK